MLAVSASAIAQKHGSSAPQTQSRNVISSTIESSDAQILADALTQEMGDSCVPAKDESPRIKVSLANMKKVSDSMIAQFTKMVQEEIAEKRGPIRLGPPEIMNQMIESPSSILAFNRFHNTRTQQTRGGPSLQERQAQAKVLEDQFVGKLADKEGHDALSLHRAAELAAELAPKIQRPFLAPSKGYPRSTLPPTKSHLFGVSLSTDKQKFFSSLEEVAPALPNMNAYLASEAAGLKRDTALVTALADGLALSVPTALISVAKQGLLRPATAGVLATMTPGASEAPNAAGQVAGAPVKVMLITTMVQTLRNDLRTTLTTIGNVEVRTKTKEAIGVLPAEAPKSLVRASSEAEENKDIEEAVIAALPTSEASGGTKIEVPNVVNPKAFTDAILSIREATKAYLNNPQLLRNVDSTNAKASSALEATLGTLSDTRSSNDALMLNMQSFYNTSERARADYIAMAGLLKKSRSSKVPRSEIDKLSSTLDSDINLMLEKMDDSASILSNQSEYFSKGIAAINVACASDARAIYDSWGKYRRVFRDKLGASPFSGEVSPSRAYLADAILARADCVTKKSIARRMEMMRLGTVLTQFKSSCADIKRWSAAGKAYRAARDRLVANSKSTSMVPYALPEVRGVQQ